MKKKQKEFLSSREFCDLLGIAHGTFKAMLKRGLPHYITGPQGVYRISKRAALRWLKTEERRENKNELETTNERTD